MIKKIFILFLVLLFIPLSFATNETIQGQNMGSYGVDSNNIFFIDFSQNSNILVFSLLLIILFISFIFSINIINSLILLFTSMILLANGFNIFISFILFLVSFIFLIKSKR